MLNVYPDFYRSFECTAAACRHSCCVGWEIDIDSESCTRFLNMGGRLGESLRAGIETGPSPRFILDADERCPMLLENGLCRLILEQGEESLCDICREHPRFYNTYEGRREFGLGLCCEEAARLLLADKTPLKLVCETDGEAEREAPPLLSLRERILTLLEDGSAGMYERMDRALGLAGSCLPRRGCGETADFYLTLEMLDDSWKRLLERLRDCPGELPEPRGAEYGRAAGYFVFRHLDLEGSMEEAADAVRFSFFSVLVINALSRYESTAEVLRMYSSEIEYSDENIGMVLDWLDEGQ